MKLYRLIAFSEEEKGGNPAGVVIGADNLTYNEMLSMAAEIGYSETAFVMNSNNADFKVRFFTPVDEVDLCGHATVATFNLLRHIGEIELGIYSQETKAGILRIVVHENYIMMEQRKPVFSEVIDISELEECFDMLKDNLVDQLPIQIVSTGLRDIILPVKNLEALFRLRPNIEKIITLSEKYDVVGIHAYTLETLKDANMHTRNFAPRYGIVEESATGTSNGALSCYVRKHMKDITERKFVIEQGYCMDRPSRIITELLYSDEEIEAVYVGGTAYIL